MDGAGGGCCPTRRGEWWIRLTLNLSRHLKREEEALEVLHSSVSVSHHLKWLIGVSEVLNVLLVDIYPGQPATVTAANNLVRCLLGAAATAVIKPMINVIGTG